MTYQKAVKFLPKLKEGTMVELISSCGKKFVGFYWGKKNDCFYYPEDELNFGLEDRIQDEFSMSSPQGVEPFDEDYGLEMSLPEFFLSKRKGVYIIGGKRITKCRNLDPYEFERRNIDEISNDEIGKITLITIPGFKNYVLSYMSGLRKDGDGLLLSPYSFQHPVDLFIEGDFDSDADDKRIHILKAPFPEVFYLDCEYKAKKLITTDFKNIPVLDFAIYKDK